MPSRGQVWAIAYGLTLAVAAPVLFIQQVWSSPLPMQREGLIHLKRGQETVDVDSLLDTNQPDFFLRIEMNKPTPVPEPSPASGSPIGGGMDEAITSASSDSEEPYEPYLLADEASPLPAKPQDPSARPTPAVSERVRIVADALFRAPMLAREGRYRQALESVDAALGVDDEVATLHALRGSLCFKLGRDGEAEEAWSRALELDPRLTDTRNALDWIRNRRR